MDWRIVLGAAAVAGLMVTCVTLIFKMGAWKGSTDTSLGNLRDDAKKDRAIVKEFMAEIREDVKHIFQRLSPPPPAIGQSPARLTDYGKDLSRSMAAERWAQELAPTLMSQVQGKEAFQVDAFCRKRARRYAGTPRVLKAMYEFGRSKPDDMLVVLAIVLRDELLKRQSRGVDDDET